MGKLKAREQSYPRRVANARRTQAAARALLATLFAFCAAGTTQAATDYYASPDGDGNGSLERPWSLASALTSKLVSAGDTIWLRGGVYRGPFTTTVAGTPLSPVVVRNYERERVVLDGSLAGRTFKNVGVLAVRGG
jgi:hypothetical protein